MVGFVNTDPGPILLHSKNFKQIILDRIIHVRSLNTALKGMDWRKVLNQIAKLCSFAKLVF